MAAFKTDTGDNRPDSISTWPAMIWENAKLELLLDLHGMDMNKIGHSEIMVGINSKYNFVDMTERVIALPGHSFIICTS